MIASYSTTSSGILTVVTVASTLTGVVYFNWFVDGRFVDQTTVAEYTFAIPPGQQADVVCVDSNDPALDDFSDDFSDDFGWDDSTVAGWPSTRTLVFVRSLDASVASYEIQQQKNGGSWATLNSLADDPSQWSYQFTTGALDDLSDYAWQVVPIDQAGNAGTPVTLAAEYIVRTPDAPVFALSVSAGHLVFGAA